ncbi:hypothetical protein BC939DRAFT_460527 [Gamsiella multidivaricata]|uniref:uncharacterized protein n=1 Tax=Gamsiella multidivaricata TaxID=101098 RepID=UPI0022206532|nr:uncharacterized protein BC939DRAFT_460527 [Gamsiella multidivaricata]KAI7819196.1 hypothetical protein BC939DRAFT_460527 [Gamsiella multidivaricata]
MYSSFSWRTLFLLSLGLLSAFTIQITSAQSDNCHSCIKRAIPSIPDCVGLSTAQLSTLDTIMHGNDVYDKVEQFRTAEPAAFKCLDAMMWDILHYKAKFWSQCLEPKAACSWSEMMQYLTIIPRISGVYGVKNLPAQVLIDGPA